MKDYEYPSERESAIEDFVKTSNPDDIARGSPLLAGLFTGVFYDIKSNLNAGSNAFNFGTTADVKGYAMKLGITLATIKKQRYDHEMHADLKQFPYLFNLMLIDFAVILIGYTTRVRETFESSLELCFNKYPDLQILTFTVKGKLKSQKKGAKSK